MTEINRSNLTYHDELYLFNTLLSIEKNKVGTQKNSIEFHPLFYILVKLKKKIKIRLCWVDKAHI